MNQISTHIAVCPSALANEVNIISRREIEPLLAKARQILMYYSQAVGCPVTIRDRTGLAIHAPEYQSQMRFCDSCRKYCQNDSRNYEENEFSCDKMLADVLAESRLREEPYIYSCAMGFIYWTSPIYRNGRYAGALVAGEVLPNEQKSASERRFIPGINNFSADKLKTLLEEAPKRNIEEIQAMARLLGVCAREISEKGEDTSSVSVHASWDEVDNMDLTETVQAQTIVERPKHYPPSQSITGSLSAAGSDPGKAGNDPDETGNVSDEVPLKKHTDSEYLLEKERMLLAAFRRGDNATGVSILNELMESIFKAIPEKHEIVQFRALELAVLLSRAATATDSSGSDALLEMNNRYIKQILESVTAEELIENLRHISERMAGKIFSFQGICHSSVLRKAERYIWENYTRKISLDEISKAAGLSAPYFSTIFKEEMGENFSGYLNRLRVERAAVLLTETRKPLNEIAGLCGFADQSWFSKIFKNYTGMSPGKYRERGGRLPLRGGKKNTGKEINFPAALIQSRDTEGILTS